METETVTKKVNRILIVDDNESIHEDLKSMLLTSGIIDSAEKEELKRELFGDDFPSDEENDNAFSGSSDDEDDFVYEINDAYQGEEAVKMVSQAEESGKPYSLIFMHLRMPPGMDGIVTIKEIWKRWPNVEVVICTAYSDYSWEKIYSMIGKSPRLLFVRKPFDMVAIKQIALTLTTKWELDRKNREHVDTLEDKINERTYELRELVTQKDSYISQIQEELTLAEMVQKMFIPKQLPSIDCGTVSSKYIPSGKVGGDFFGVYNISAEKTAFLVFDVSGHGIAASLVTAIGRSAFADRIKRGLSPEVILEKVNLDIYKCTPAEMYITSFLLVYDKTTGMAHYSGSGHIPQLHFISDSNEIEEMSGKGFFLGMEPSTKYDLRETVINPGDKILLFTDGLTETFNADDEMYGKKRVKASFLEHAKKNTFDLPDLMLEDNKKFMGPSRVRDDDLCVLFFEAK